MSERSRQRNESDKRIGAGKIAAWILVAGGVSTGVVFAGEAIVKSKAAISDTETLIAPGASSAPSTPSQPIRSVTPAAETAPSPIPTPEVTPTVKPAIRHYIIPTTPLSSESIDALHEAQAVTRLTPEMHVELNKSTKDALIQSVEGIRTSMASEKQVPIDKIDGRTPENTGYVLSEYALEFQQYTADQPYGGVAIQVEPLSDQLNSVGVRFTVLEEQVSDGVLSARQLEFINPEAKYGPLVFNDWQQDFLDPRTQFVEGFAGDSEKVYAASVSESGLVDTYVTEVVQFRADSDGAILYLPPATDAEGIKHVLGEVVGEPTVLKLYPKG